MMSAPLALQGSASNEPGRGSGWLFHQAWIEADLSDAGRLRWDTSLAPWLLDRTPDGTWYLVGWTPSSSGIREYQLGRPSGGEKTFVAFRLTGDRWERIKVEEFPDTFKGPNLLVSSERMFSKQKDFIYFDGATHRGASLRAPLSNGDLLDLK